MTREGKSGGEGWRRNWRLLPAMTAVAIAAACGGGDDGAETTGNTDTTPATAAPTTPTSELQAAKFMFDDLDGGEPTVNVYLTPFGAPGEVPITSTYNDGEEMPVECYVTDGRAIPHHPEVGEQDPDPSSNEDSTTWFRLAVPGPDPQFATDTYGDVNIPPAQLAEQLPTCEF